MARKAEGAGKIRAELEGATLALVDVEECMPTVVLRIEQAIRRAGLSTLLMPALTDLQRMAASVREAKSQVNAATVKLMER
jgi:predicted nuclease with TOPRIM domain